MICKCKIKSGYLLVGILEIIRFGKILTMNRAVLLLGSNTGDLPGNLNLALKLIAAKIGTINTLSHIYKTEPWGLTDQPFYYNQVVEVLTDFDAHRLMDNLLEIETDIGRKRTEKWAPRIIDLDILYFNDEIVNERGLTIPHPHLHERRFTLAPLTEVFPEMIHPVLKKKNSDLLASLNDTLSVWKVNSKIPVNH
jgi:2-amino-4-hydroxy-6-hydroxymethyldihydropteridine diphosphokinase